MPATIATTPIHARSFDDLLADAVSFHGHMCPGQVLGVRMTLAGCRAIGVEDPQGAGKSFIVIAEIDRCATDAIQALTGVSLGKRTLKYVDFGKMAATFVNTVTGVSVRVAAREEARERAARLMPAERDPRQAQMLAYRIMNERELLSLTSVTVSAGLLDRRRIRVVCQACGEGVTYEREVQRDGLVLCRACAGEAYYRDDAGRA